MFENASNRRGHLAKTFNPFLPLAVQPQGAPQLQRSTVVSHQRAADPCLGSCRDPSLLTRAWCSCLCHGPSLGAASPITTGRKTIPALIATVTLPKLWQNLSSGSLWPSQSFLFFFCFLSAERAGRMKDSWEGRESWMWTKSCQRNMRREFCPISFNKVVG